jgi:hypothetical protein
MSALRPKTAVAMHGAGNGVTTIAQRHHALAPLRSGRLWHSPRAPHEAERAKRSLYIFFDEFGDFVGGNHSGKIQ